MMLHEFLQIISTGTVDVCILKKNLGWLNIKQRRDYFVCLLAFKSLKISLPDDIADKFTMTSEIVGPQDPFQTINFFCLS